MKKHWSQRYIGLPYEKANCAQLAVRVQREIFNRELSLPIPADYSAVQYGRHIDNITLDYGIPTDKPAEGDAVLMRARGILSHVGLYCRIYHTPYVLHAMKNAGHTCLHKIRQLDSAGLELVGYYKWK